MNHGKSWVVGLPSAHYHYQWPIALAEAGALRYYVTDWFVPEDDWLWSKVLRLLPSHATIHKLGNRGDSRIPTGTVRDRKVATILERANLLLRSPMSGSRWLGARAVRAANATNASVVVGSYSGWDNFGKYTAGGKKVLYQIHPHAPYLRNYYTGVISRSPAYSGLALENEVALPDSILNIWSQQAKSADLIVANSDYSKRSLVESGIADHKIAVVALGVDTARFKPQPVQRGDRLVVLFVGSMVARKGLIPLLSAWEAMPQNSAHLIIIGRGTTDSNLLRELPAHCEIRHNVEHAELVRLYNEADLLAVPSVAEGFGMVYLESLACGTPVLASKNTGAADIISEGKNGWIIEPLDVDALTERLRWAARNITAVREMRACALETGRFFTWERFRRNLRQVLLSE